MTKVTYLKDYKVSDFLIEHVDLTFELDKQKTHVHSKLHVRPNPSSGNKEKKLTLQGENLQLQSIAINGKPLDISEYQIIDNELIIKDITEPCVVEICNTINPELNTELRGLYLSQNKFTTHCEAEGFRRITYFIDRPDVMATYTTTIIADKQQCPIMLSNGNFVAEGTTADGRQYITWNDPFKKPSYLFALVAGDFDCVEDIYRTLSGRIIKLQFYAERGMGERCRHAIESLKDAMRWDEENYDRECDLDTYKVVAIADFNVGAMENKGLNIFNAKAILAHPARVTDERYIGIKGTVAHEYFHNWTGDRITVRDWFQIANKEGLTTFRNQTHIEDNCTKAARTMYVKDLRSRQFPEDAGPLAHPVQPKSYIVPDNFYTATVYRKGAEIFRMLRTLLGVETFRKCMNLYFSRHDGEAVTIEQFLAAMQDGSGVDLSEFALWFHQAGTPQIEVEELYIPENQEYILTLKQSTKPTPGQPDKKPLVIPIRMGLLGTDGKPMPLHLNDRKDAPLEQVLVLSDSKERFVFKNVTSKPVLSLFRDFSAPVKVSCNTSEEDYRRLVEHDTDPFNRLEASQRYIMNQLEQLIKQLQHGEPLKVSSQFIETMGSILNSNASDLWVLAEMLSIPSESYLADQLDGVDVDVLHIVREFLISNLSFQLKDSLLSVYNKMNTQAVQSDRFDIKEASKRRLKNQCLSFLYYLNSPEIEQLAMTQFRQELRINMTNTMAVFKGLNQLSNSNSNYVLSQSYALWQDDTLTMDYWFAAQASAAQSIATIQLLMSHPKFDIKQPNKVNALIGTFCENMMIFHDKSGKGYQFLAETILNLDKINPKVASDLALNLTNWRRFDNLRQSLMKAVLQTMLKQPMSPKLFEIVSKSLDESQKVPVSELKLGFFNKLPISSHLESQAFSPEFL